MNKFQKYFLIAVLLWIIVDFTTAFNPDFQGWLAHMPLIWLFYLGYPLLFAFLIYKRRLTERDIFLVMLVASFVVEVVLSSNSLLYTFPIMLIMIPIAICIYTLVTFAPKWMVENKIKEHRGKLILITFVWVIVAILNFITQTGGLK